jgi:hypothetical protein
VDRALTALSSPELRGDEERLRMTLEAAVEELLNSALLAD